jgi:hypothetical protein
MRFMLAFMSVGVICISGCAYRKGVHLATPDSIDAISTWRTASIAAVSDINIGVPTDDKGKRDVAISYSTALVMAQYGSVRTSLMKGRAVGSIVFDVLDLGLTTTVPIANGQRGKTILGALATGFKGTNLSIDKNFFNQQTTSAILAAMDGCILRERKVVDTKRALSVADYSIYDAYSDLVNLYGCTTLAGAMEELVETQSVATREQRSTIVTISAAELDNFKGAQAAFIASVDDGKLAALAFLNEMGVTNLTAQSSKEDFIAAYRKLNVAALTTTDGKTKFLAAASTAGLTK